MCNPRSPRQDPRRAPALRGEGLPRGAPRVARAGSASSPRIGARGTRGAPASAPTPPTAPLRAAAGRTPAELPAPASPAPQGPATHRLEAPGCPHRRGPRPCGQEAARARARGHPQPPAQGRPGTRDSGQWHSRGPGPARPGARAHPRARAWDSPAPGESCGAAAAAAALHGDSSSERGARRGGPEGPAQGRLRALGPGWRGRPSCRGLEAAARRARRRHGRGASGGRPGAAGEELAVAGLGREVPATSWCSDLHTAPGGRGSDRLAPAQGLGLWCGRRASFEGRET